MSAIAASAISALLTTPVRIQPSLEWARLERADLHEEGAAHGSAVKTAELTVPPLLVVAPAPSLPGLPADDVAALPAPCDALSPQPSASHALAITHPEATAVPHLAGAMARLYAKTRATGSEPAAVVAPER